MKSTLVKKVQNFIFNEKLIYRGDKIIVGVSGGPDSTALILILDKLKKKYDLNLAVVHVNYGTRGRESEKEENFVRELAEKLKLPIKVFPYLESAERQNQEEQFRLFRYKVFEEERARRSFDKIAVGHTLDDRIETFLMNMIRGAGLQGLTGLKAKYKKLIRPLLAFEKQEIKNYLEEKKQVFCLDKSNYDKKFLRNRIRIELIPLLKRNYNPQIKELINKLSVNLQEEEDYLSDCAEKFYNSIAKNKRGKAIVYIDRLMMEPEGLQRRVFRKACLSLLGNNRDISSNHFFEFKKIMESEKSKLARINLGKIILEKKKNRVIFKKV